MPRTRDGADPTGASLSRAFRRGKVPVRTVVLGLFIRRSPVRIMGMAGHVPAPSPCRQIPEQWCAWLLREHHLGRMARERCVPFLRGHGLQEGARYRGIQRPVILRGGHAAPGFLLQSFRARSPVHDSSVPCPVEHGPHPRPRGCWSRCVQPRPRWCEGAPCERKRIQYRGGLEGAGIGHAVRPILRTCFAAHRRPPRAGQCAKLLCTDGASTPASGLRHRMWPGSGTSLERSINC